MYFNIIICVENGLFTSRKSGDILLEMLIFHLKFQGEGQFYANFWFYILIA